MFHVTLFHPGTADYVRRMMTHDFALGYAVGLVVGAGSFTGDRRQPALSVKMSERDRAPLDHLQGVFGGSIFGPYHHGERRYYMYLLRGPSLRSTIPLLLERMPSCRKRDQLLAWVARHGALLGANAPGADEHAQPGTPGPTPHRAGPARFNTE